MCDLEHQEPYIFTNEELLYEVKHANANLTAPGWVAVRIEVLKELKEKAWMYDELTK